MAKTREIVCENYEYEGGICNLRGIECHFNKEMQKCQKYVAKKHTLPRRADTRRKKLGKLNKEMD